MLKLNSFSVAFRGSKTFGSGANGNIGFNFHFTDGMQSGGGSGVLTSGTWDPAIGDIIIFAQSHTRYASISAPTPTSYTSLDVNTSAPTWSSNHVHNPGTKGQSNHTHTHRAGYGIAYKVLTGSTQSTKQVDSIWNSTSSMTDLVGICDLFGFSNAGSGQGLTYQAHLYRPTAAGSIANTHNTGQVSASALSNQTIGAQTEDVVLQYAFGGSSSISSTAQTMTTAGDNTTTLYASYSSGSLVTTLNAASNAAVGVDRGEGNYLTSGSLRITAP